MQRPHSRKLRFNATGLYVRRRQPSNFLVCREALLVEPTCVQALYNIGLVSREIDDFETALSSFYKLNNMLTNNVQVLTQLASIYESIKDYGQANDLYLQASSLFATFSIVLYTPFGVHTFKILRPLIRQFCSSSPKSQIAKIIDRKPINTTSM